jgi:hypothetical protein
MSIVCGHPGYLTSTDVSFREFVKVKGQQLSLAVKTAFQVLGQSNFYSITLVFLGCSQIFQSFWLVTEKLEWNS